MGSKISVFEMILLVVGIAAAVLGFQLVNQAYNIEKEVSWLMVIAIFSWLTLLVLFISLSISVEVAKKQLEETKKMAELLGQMKSKKR